jgi:hypothetical protein
MIQGSVSRALIENSGHVGNRICRENRATRWARFAVVGTREAQQRKGLLPKREEEKGNEEEIKE